MNVKDAVREKYGQAALDVRKAKASCCGSEPSRSCSDPITSDLYDAAKAAPVRQKLCWLCRCGYPTAVAELKPGRCDLGSGGGIDVLLSAVGLPELARLRLDMTDEMLALARENQRKAEVENVEFRKGRDRKHSYARQFRRCIISNCVINLSGDEDRVLQEAFRVLKAGGRLAVSDVVTKGDVPEVVRRDMLLWVGCIAGALQDIEYDAKLVKAGFENINIEPTRVYNIEDARAFLADKGIDVDALAPQVEGKFMAAFVRAVKPKALVKP